MKINQELDQYFQLFINKRQRNQYNLLSLVEFQYNNYMYLSIQPCLCNSNSDILEQAYYYIEQSLSLEISILFSQNFLKVSMQFSNFLDSKLRISQRFKVLVSSTQFPSHILSRFIYSYNKFSSHKTKFYNLRNFLSYPVIQWSLFDEYSYSL